MSSILRQILKKKEKKFICHIRPAKTNFFASLGPLLLSHFFLESVDTQILHATSLFKAEGRERGAPFPCTLNHLN